MRYKIALRRKQRQNIDLIGHCLCLRYFMHRRLDYELRCTRSSAPTGVKLEGKKRKQRMGDEGSGRGSGSRGCWDEGSDGEMENGGIDGEEKLRVPMQ